jgi:hypothetical protein
VDHLVRCFILFSAMMARLFVWPDLPPLSGTGPTPSLSWVGRVIGMARFWVSPAKKGWAPVLVQSTVAAEAGTDTCLPLVPDVKIICFHPDPGTTRGEARAIGALAAKYHWPRSSW